jgi:hypothetical protein
MNSAMGAPPTSGSATPRTEITTDPSTRPDTQGASRILPASFSRAGENDDNGGRINLRVGNTQVGRTVRPVVTDAVSGLGRAERDYIESCPGGRFRRPLAVRGESLADAGPQIDSWLRASGLT